MVEKRRKVSQVCEYTCVMDLGCGSSFRTWSHFSILHLSLFKHTSASCSPEAFLSLSNLHTFSSQKFYCSEILLLIWLRGCDEAVEASITTVQWAVGDVVFFPEPAKEDRIGLATFWKAPVRITGGADPGVLSSFFWSLTSSRAECSPLVQEIFRKCSLNDKWAQGHGSSLWILSRSQLIC